MKKLEKNSKEMTTNVKASPVDEKGMVNDAVTGINSEANVSDEGKGKGELGDTRKDSITDRPKTETYEKSSNTANAVHNENEGHEKEEEKRQRENKSNVNY